MENMNGRWTLWIHSRTQSKEFGIDLLRFKTHNIQQATFGKTPRKILCEETIESSKKSFDKYLEIWLDRIRTQREKQYRDIHQIPVSPLENEHLRTTSKRKTQSSAPLGLGLGLGLSLSCSRTFTVRSNIPRPIIAEWKPLCDPIATFSRRSSFSLRRFAGRPSGAGVEEKSSRRRRRRRSRQGSSHACRSWAAISDQGFVLASFQA